MQLPINGQSFQKSFLNGVGDFEISTDQDIWQTLVNANQPFNPNIDSLAEINVDLATNNNLKFGGQGAHELKLDVDVAAKTVGSVRLVWDPTDKVIKAFDVRDLFTDSHYFALLSFNSIADASIAGNASLFGGPLKASFGIGAGGHVGYERLVRFQRTDPARTVIEEIFKGVRLPQSVRTVADLPDDGEVLSFKYGGYLNLSAGLTWGYSLTGTKGVELANMDLSLEYALKLVAAASFNYRIAGDFQFEARRGKTANQARIVVRKARESTSKFAADFGFTAKADLKGVPESPQKLLEALLEIDTKSFVRVLEEIRSVSTIEGIKDKLNDLADEFIISRSVKWLGVALDATNVTAFLQIVNQIVEAYDNVDEHIIHLYEDFIDDIPGLNAMLDRIINLPNRLGLGQFDHVADAAVWDLIRRLAGDKFYELLVADTEFESFTDFVKGIKKFLNDGVSKHLRDFIADLKENFPLNDLFDLLRPVDTVTEIKAIADKKLKALIGRIVGEGIDGNADLVNNVLKPLQTFFRNLDKFNEKYAEAIEKAVNQSFAFNLNFAYNTLAKGEKLLDVEIDLSTAKGRTLASNALNGDFEELLLNFDPTVVTLNQAMFTEEVVRSAELKINIFNFNKRGVVRLIQQSQHTVESLESGLLHLYSIDTAQETLDEKGWRRNKEKIKTNFALKVVGNSFQPTDSNLNPEVVQSLKTISAKYEASFDDSQTKIKELRQYFDFASLLNLLTRTQIDEILESLRALIGDPLGKAKLEYVVKYSDDVIREVLTSPNEPGFEDNLRRVIREITAAPFMSKPINNNECSMRLAYLAPSMFQMYRSNSNRLGGLGSLKVTAPQWHRSAGTSIQLNSAQIMLLEFFYRTEDSIVQRFPKLLNVLREFPNVDLDDLQDEARKFVSLSNDLLSNAGENPFFALFDWFVRTKVNSPQTRQSALVLSIESTLPDGSAYASTRYYSG